jgi:hypothetical protein
MFPYSARTSPFAVHYGLDVNMLWNWQGLNEIWEEAYAEVEGVT